MIMSIYSDSELFRMADDARDLWIYLLCGCEMDASDEQVVEAKKDYDLYLEELCKRGLEFDYAEHCYFFGC